MSKDFQKQFMASATGIWYTQKDFENAVEDAKAEIIATAMQTAKYAVDEDFLMEGYRAASNPMKAKLRKQFPEAFKPKVIEFGRKFELNEGTSGPIYIGNGVAPDGLEGKCLVLRDGVTVKTRKHDGRTILVFEQTI